MAIREAHDKKKSDKNIIPVIRTSVFYKSFKILDFYTIVNKPPSYRDGKLSLNITPAIPIITV